MHFYFHLITQLFPFAILNNSENQPPVGEKFVVNFAGQQVVTFNNALLIAED